MNHDMLVVTDRMAKAIVTAMALHGFLASCIAELQQKLNDETFPCESNFDCSIISGHSSRKIFCGYKLNTLLRLRTFCCELSSTQECSEDRDPGGTTRPAGLLRHSSRLPCTPRLTAGLLPGLPRFSGRCPRPRLPVAPVTACVFLLKRKAIDALLDK